MKNKSKGLGTRQQRHFAMGNQRRLQPSFLAQLLFILTFVCTCTSSFYNIKVGLIVDENSPVDLPWYFSKTISHFKTVPSTIELKEIVLRWDARRPPLQNLEAVEVELLQANISVVFSFLESKNSEIFCDLMANAKVPIINLLSECSHWSRNFTTNGDGNLILSMFPSDRLLAAATRDMMLEFDQSRFTCITTSTKKYDPFWRYFFEYVVNQDNNSTQGFPKCLILKDPSSIDDLHKTLTAVRASGVKIIIIYAESSQASIILEISQKLSLQNIGEDIIWILTDMATRSDPMHVPYGTIGIAKAFNASRDHIHGPEDFDGMDQLLLYDAVTVVQRAISRLVHKNATLLEDIYGSGLTTASKENLNREMLNSSFIGKTGLIEFSSTGQRISYDFIITKLDQHSDKAKQWVRLGTAPTHRKHSIEPQVFSPFMEKDLPKPRHLRIVTIVHSPFTMTKRPHYSNILGTSCISRNSVLCKKYMNTTATERIVKDSLESNEPQYELLCCYGVMIDILLLMQLQTGFTYDLYIVRDGKFGSFDEKTQRMSGMIGDIYRGEADMALATITITHHRYKFVNFAAPYMGTSLAFLVKRQPIKKYSFSESLQDMRLMKPFSVRLWLACGATFLAVSTSVFLIEKLTKYRKTKSDYFLPFEYLAYVFGNIFHVPLTRLHAKTFAVPCLMVWANFGGLVLISSYTANLLVSLITVDEVTIVKGIHDEKLLKPSKDFTFGTIKDSSVEDYFRKSDITWLTKIYENMKDNSVQNFSEGVRKVKSGELSAFIGESDALQYIIDEDPKCGLKIDGKQIDLAGLAFALRKDSEWEDEISKCIYKLNNEDAITKAFGRWTIRSCKQGENKVIPFGFDEFGGFLFNTALCCIGCFFILGLEILLYRRITRTRQKFTITTCESTCTLVPSTSTQGIVRSTNEATNGLAHAHLPAENRSKTSNGSVLN